MFNDGAENEFTFSGCVTSIDNFRDGFILDEFHDGGELFLCSPTFWFVLKRIGDKREALNGVSPIFERLVVIVHVL